MTRARFAGFILMAEVAQRTGGLDARGGDTAAGSAPDLDSCPSGRDGRRDTSADARELGPRRGHLGDAAYPQDASGDAAQFELIGHGSPDGSDGAIEPELHGITTARSILESARITRPDA